MFTADQLAKFTGAGPPTHSRRIYLAILGSVFDVTDGARNYGMQRCLLNTCPQFVCAYSVCKQPEAVASIHQNIAGPTGNYRGAAGKDASKAFVSGTVAQQCMPDMSLQGFQSRSFHRAELTACSNVHAWRAGNFTADQTDDLTDFKPDELASVFRWRNFFRDHKVSTL
jgi:hypothetical protein